MLVSVFTVQSSMFFCLLVSLFLLPKIDVVLAQVSTAAVVFLILYHMIINRKSDNEEPVPVQPKKYKLSYEQYEYVPPCRVWSRRGNKTGGSVPKKCNVQIFQRGYLASDESDTSASTLTVNEAMERAPVPKYQDLLSAGAAPLLAVPRKIGADIITEEKAKQLLERLHELECRSDRRNDLDKRSAMPRRIVAGIRDAAKALQRGRAQAIVFASDAGADSKVADLMAQASWKGIPVMVALKRAQLGKMIVRADITATVLVILHAEGCEELFEEVTGQKPLPPRAEVIPAEDSLQFETNGMSVASEQRARTEEVAKQYPWTRVDASEALLNHPAVKTRC